MIWIREFERAVRLRDLAAALPLLAIFAFEDYGNAQTVKHDARGFECGFVYEKTKGGKSGETVCSYNAEKVFSSAVHRFPPGKYCDPKEVFSFEDIKLQIDLETSQVVREREDGLAPFAVQEMINYYMTKEKLSKEDATKKVLQRPGLPMKEVTYRIFQVHKGDEFVSEDPITHSLPKDPKNIPVYTLTFGWNVRNNLFSLFIPDNGVGSEAILSQYVADGTSSWVRIRFGKCRVVK